MTKLTSRRSAPRKGPALSRAAVAKLLKEVPKWKVDAASQSIRRTFKFKDYYGTMAFVNAVAVDRPHGRSPSRHDGRVQQGRRSCFPPTRSAGSRRTTSSAPRRSTRSIPPDRAEHDVRMLRRVGDALPVPLHLAVGTDPDRRSDDADHLVVRRGPSLPTRRTWSSPHASGPTAACTGVCTSTRTPDGKRLNRARPRGRPPRPS